MAITDPNVVDAIGISKEDGALVLLISDHLDWEDEYAHLNALQDKLNSYVLFIVEKQYASLFPNRTFDSFVIDIAQLHGSTENCDKFIEVCSAHVAEDNIYLRLRDESEDEA